MAIITGNYFGKEIADILGLQYTRQITLSIPYDDAVGVEVTMLLTDEASKQITGWMQTKRFRLELIDEDEPINLFEEGTAETTKMGDEIRTYAVEA